MNYPGVIQGDPSLWAKLYVTGSALGRGTLRASGEKISVPTSSRGVIRITRALLWRRGWKNSAGDVAHDPGGGHGAQS